MSLIQSAKLNGHDPYAYLKDVLTRLPTQKTADIAELLPHCWAALSHTRIRIGSVECSRQGIHTEPWHESRSTRFFSTQIDVYTKTMPVRNIAILCAALPLFGCVTYQDPRSLEQQKAELRSAANELVGTYEVIDSRNDDRRGYARTIVSKNEGSDELSVVMISLKNGADALNGKNCLGWYATSQRPTSVMCDSYPREINYFVLKKIASESTVKDGAVIPSFAPMVVPNGTYLFEIADRGGKTHYYVLAKKTAQR